eukprot:scaffold193318_cov25-Tisochrysis_lutea.AAC.3
MGLIPRSLARWTLRRGGPQHKSVCVSKAVPLSFAVRQPPKLFHGRIQRAADRILWESPHTGRTTQWVKHPQYPVNATNSATPRARWGRGPPELDDTR